MVSLHKLLPRVALFKIVKIYLDCDETERYSVTQYNKATDLKLLIF